MPIKIFAVHIHSCEISVSVCCVVIKPLFCAAAGCILCDLILIVYPHAAAHMADGIQNMEKLADT